MESELIEFLETLEGGSPIAEQLRRAIDEPGCRAPLHACYWWLRAGKIQSRNRGSHRRAAATEGEN
jgi:hypothetical protein